MAKQKYDFVGGQPHIQATAEQAEGQKLNYLRESEAWGAVECAARARAFELADDPDVAAHWSDQAAAALVRVMSAPEYADLPPFTAKDHVTVYLMLEALGMLD